MKVNDIRVGTLLLDRYRLLRCIGKGSFGQVFEAFDTSASDRVAVKVSNGDEYSVDRGTQEARILETIGQTKSPYNRYVIGLRVWYSLPDCVVVVLELLSHDLTRSIRRNVFNGFYKTSIYAEQMVKFLLYMSREEIVHGDIKPDNILVKSGGHRIKFADFGLSCSMLADRPRDHLIQTLFYRAPEVVLGYDFDTSVDTWSVGCVLAECLLKFPLFEAYSEGNLMRKIVYVVGLPQQDVIENAPRRNKFFVYNEEHKLWLLRNQAKPVTPLGIGNFIRMHYKGDSSTEACSKFLDLIEGMVMVHPHTRYTPEECLALPFFRL